MQGLIKNDQVVMSGARMLGTSQISQAPAQGPQARIVESKDGMVVVEVTCDCGRRILLNCDCRTA